MPPPRALRQKDPGSRLFPIRYRGFGEPPDSPVRVAADRFRDDSNGNRINRTQASKLTSTDLRNGRTFFAHDLTINSMANDAKEVSKTRTRVNHPTTTRSWIHRRSMRRSCSCTGTNCIAERENTKLEGKRNADRSLTVLSSRSYRRFYSRSTKISDKNTMVISGKRKE